MKQAKFPPFIWYKELLTFVLEDEAAFTDNRIDWVDDCTRTYYLIK